MIIGFHEVLVNILDEFIRVGGLRAIDDVNGFSDGETTF